MNSDSPASMHEMRKLFKMCLGLYVSALLFGTEDTSECTFKNISSSREACNLEDVLYDWWPFPVLSKKCPCILTDCLLCDSREGRANSGRVYHHKLWGVTMWAAICMYVQWSCSPLLWLVTERYVCPWLDFLQTPLTFPAAQQRDSAEAQVTHSADGSSVSAFSLVPSSTKLFPAKKYKYLSHAVYLFDYFILHDKWYTESKIFI